MRDTIVQSLIDKFKSRSKIGFGKYGKTLDRNDLSETEWLTHLQEELMDASLYIEKLKTPKPVLPSLNTAQSFILKLLNENPTFAIQTKSGHLYMCDGNEPLFRIYRNDYKILKCLI